MDDIGIIKQILTNCVEDLQDIWKIYIKNTVVFFKEKKMNILKAVAVIKYIKNEKSTNNYIKFQSILWNFKE